MKHGTWHSLYVHKCKCEVCLQGRVAILQTRRDRRKGIFNPMAPLAHGTTAMYWSGCRCEECKAANTRYQRERRKVGQDGPAVGSTSPTQQTR